MDKTDGPLAHPPHKRRRSDRLPELSETMTRTNLIEALSAMGFQHGSRLVMIDEPVRDYLVDALRRR